ncbi:hypothetical protein Q1695_013579 [Nippostrongylus brasiliensis]|nr:hypothetical protein Q1695_013579 [Nippostrongylus brasiliensis]
MLCRLVVLLGLCFGWTQSISCYTERLAGWNLAGGENYLEKKNQVKVVSQGIYGMAEMVISCNYDFCNGFSGVTARLALVAFKNRTDTDYIIYFVEGFARQWRKRLSKDKEESTVFNITEAAILAVLIFVLFLHLGSGVVSYSMQTRRAKKGTRTKTSGTAKSSKG